MNLSEKIEKIIHDAQDDYSVDRKHMPSQKIRAREILDLLGVKNESSEEKAELTTKVNMRLVYGVSRWTNPSRASARHIDNGKGQPLCRDRRKVFSWEREEGKPTCQKCIYIIMRQ